MRLVELDEDDDDDWLLELEEELELELDNEDMLDDDDVANGFSDAIKAKQNGYGCKKFQGMKQYSHPDYDMSEFDCVFDGVD